jgi:signal transduction histidine kinase
LRRVPIRLKLAAALSIPLLALAVVTVLEVVKSVDDVSDVREQTDLAVSATGPSGLITALQNERTWPGVDLVGYAGAVTVMVEGYEQTRADTDEAIRQFRDLVTAKGGAIEAAYGPVLDQLDQLGPLRAEIDANVAANPTRTIENNGDFSQHVFETYTGLIEPIFDATTRISLAINDPELRQGTELADAAARQIEVLSQLASAVIRDVTNPDGTGLDTAAEVTRASTYESAFVRNADTMRNATGVYADIAATTFPTQLTDDVVAAVDTAITEGTVDINTLLEALNIPQEESYGAYQQAVADQIDERGDSLRDTARNRQVWFLALALIVLGTAIALTWLVTRSITKPLRSLTRQAKEMAERRLPDAVIDILETPLGDDVQVPTVDPVVVHTRDEVADVSTALNTVQDTALDLAVEQAVLRRNIADSFVNLGRRNQNLLGRQLDFITELETNETDPDTLANLFRLDHLATRMRRNAESLLVLAGIEPPRKWAAPVRLTDVIRAALGEVEDYQRVTVRGVEPATIIGSAAADLAHLLAELIENALVFSPPDQTVDIRGRTRPDGYTLAVIDSGLGMPQADIAAANRRLAGAESFTIAPSKYLGHYVAGNLAARHNIHVTLDTGAHGITATIDLPPTLLTDDAAPPAADEPHAARDVWPPVPTLGGPPTLPASGGPAPARPGGPGGPVAPIAPAGWPPGPVPDAGRPAAARPGPPSGSGPGNGGPAWTAPAAGHPGPAAEPPIGPRGPAWPPQSEAPAASSAGGGPFGGGPARAGDEEGARRTPSGLVKRTPRVVDTGEMEAVGRHPDDDLLASLSRVTRGGRPPEDPRDRQQPPPPAPGTFAAPWPPQPTFPQPAAPPAAAPEPRRSTGAPLGGLAAGLSGLSPFDPRRVGDGGHRALADGSGGGTTTGGLTRRVRGAQLPNANPVSLRRADTPPPAGPAPPAAPAGPGTSGRSARTPQQKQSADAVYSFLTSFTAGVQRGLDEARDV